MPGAFAHRVAADQAKQAAESQGLHLIARSTLKYPQWLQAGSLERLIEENKDRYYETLEQSSQGWHEDKHDPWPYINYLLSILKLAYRELRSGWAKQKRREGRRLIWCWLPLNASRANSPCRSWSRLAPV